MGSQNADLLDTLLESTDVEAFERKLDQPSASILESVQSDLFLSMGDVLETSKSSASRGHRRSRSRSRKPISRQASASSSFFDAGTQQDMFQSAFGWSAMFDTQQSLGDTWWSDEDEESDLLEDELPPSFVGTDIGTGMHARPAPGWQAMGARQAQAEEAAAALLRGVDLPGVRASGGTTSATAQVLDTQDLLDGTEDSCWADGHGCRQAGGMLATSASLLDTSSTCLDTSCLDDLMDTVQEDGLVGGRPSAEAAAAAGAPTGGAALAPWERAKSLPRLRLTWSEHAKLPLAQRSLARTQSDSATALSVPGKKGGKDSAGCAGGQPRLGRRRRRTPAEAAAARRQRVLAASAKMQAALSAPSSPRGASLVPRAPKAEDRGHFMVRAASTAGKCHRRSASTARPVVAHHGGRAARPAGSLAAGPKKQPTEVEMRGSPVSTLCPPRGGSSDDSAPVSDAEAEGCLHSLGEPMESAAAQSVLAAAEEHRLVPSGSVPLQKRAVSVPCLHRDALCFAGSCDDSSLSALPAAAASGRRVAEAEDLSMRRTCAPTSVCYNRQTAVRPGSCSDLAAVGEAEASGAPSPALLELPPHAVSVLAQLAAAADGSAGLSCLTAAPGAATDSEQGSGAGTPLAKSPCHSDAESPAESEAGRQDKQTSWRQWSPKRAASLPACVSSVCWSDDGRSCFSRSDSEESATLTAAAAEAVATSGLALAPALEHPLAAPGLPFDAETRSYLVVEAESPQAHRAGITSTRVRPVDKCGSAVVTLQCQASLLPRLAQALSALGEAGSARVLQQASGSQPDVVVPTTNGPLAASYLFSSSSRPARHLYSSSATTCLLSSQQQVVSDMEWSHEFSLPNSSNVPCGFIKEPFARRVLCCKTLPSGDLLHYELSQSRLPITIRTQASCTLVSRLIALCETQEQYFALAARRQEALGMSTYDEATFDCLGSEASERLHSLHEVATIMCDAIRGAQLAA